MAQYWEDPETWDPSRFSHNRSKGRHKYAWVPFGGGAHMCLGLHFAYMQMKSFFYTILADHRFVLPDNYTPDIQMFPIPKPRDGLPIRVERI
jgi:cytochrome P450